MSAIDLTLYYYLKQHLKVVYKTTNNDETYIRCKFCGDSKKDSRRARLYISNKPPFKFHCFNCEMSGVVDDKFLDFFINDGSYYDISKYIREKKNEYLSTKNLTYDKNIYNHPYFKKDIIDYSYTRKKDENKLKYLSERLGENITLDDIEKFKIVLNIQDYFKFNNLKLSDRFTNDREKKLFLNLRDNYIGFLSTDRNNIIFRNINPNCEKKYRFYNLKVFNDEDIESKKNYNIGGTIDIYHEKHTIIMAEGPIDIISIYKKYYTDKDNSYIFLANGGKGYSNSLQFLSDLTLLDNDIIIYSDSDVEIDFYRRLKEYSPMLKNNKVTLQYNKKSKDFGTTKDNIELANKIIL